MADCLRVLYLDIEGGFGGSSRSLYHLLAELDRRRVAPEVWYRRHGPMAQRLAQAGIAGRQEPAIRPWIPGRSANLKKLLVFLPSLPSQVRLARRIAAHDHDILHLNYEGLTHVAWMLRRLGDRRPIVLHARNHLPINRLSPRFVRLVERVADHIVFISENESQRYRDLGSEAVLRKSTILYNTAGRLARCSAFGSRGVDRRPDGSPFRVVFFGTVDESRGAHRLLDVAAALKRAKANVVIDAFGQSPRYRKLLIFKRRDREVLLARSKALNLEEYLRFPGFTSTPEAEMAKADVLLRPSVQRDPWGRDVIEAMSLGVPVVATGAYSGFVVPGVTGFLIDPWDAAHCAQLLIQLSGDAEQYRRLSSESKKRARSLFDAERYARSFKRIYENLFI